MQTTPRVIPCLLLKGQGLVKTERFKDPIYLGDPINVVRIFNDKEVDELVLLDIMATRDGRAPSFELIGKIAQECFMPLGYGGGIKDIETMHQLFRLGIEKVIINSQAVENPYFISEAANRFGSQSIVVSLDFKKTIWGGFSVFTHGGCKKTDFDPVSLAKHVETMGAGEIILNSIDRDGTMKGYNLEVTRQVAEAVGIPIVACGGAGGMADLVKAIQIGKASAAAAGSMFVFQGRLRGVLITYPTRNDLISAFDITAVS